MRAHKEIKSGKTETAEAGDRRVLTRAALRAAELLDVSQSTLARILGVSAATVTRMRQDVYRLDPERKEWELALLFVRLFCSLDSVVGGRETQAKAWLHSDNRALPSKPIDLILKVSGLVQVVNYLDASRGRA